MKRSDAKAIAIFVGRYFHSTSGGVRGELADKFVRTVSEPSKPEVVLKWPVLRDFLGPEWRPSSAHYHVNEWHEYWVKLSCGHNRIVWQYTQPALGLGIGCTVTGCWKQKAAIVAVEGIGKPPVGRDVNGIFYELKTLLDKGDWITAHSLVCDTVEAIQASTQVFK